MLIDLLSKLKAKFKELRTTEQRESIKEVDNSRCNAEEQGLVALPAPSQLTVRDAVGENDDVPEAQMIDST